MTQRTEWDGRIKCRHPFMVEDVLPVPCGRCPQCLAKRNQENARRFESEFESVGCVATFVTLTYDPELLPEGGSLSRAGLDSFRKRLQKRMAAAGIRLRMVAVGEYGEQGTQRPHYHLIIFGVNTEAVRCHVESAWCEPRTGRSIGHSQLQDVDGKATLFRYVTAYVLKGWHRKDALGLDGREREFMRWVRPMVGWSLAFSMAEALLDAIGQREVAALGQDVPKFVIRNGRQVPAGKAITCKVRQLLGLNSELAKLTRRKLLRRRLVAAGREFARKYPDRDWREVDAHVDQVGLDIAARKRCFYGGARKNGSL